MHIAQSLCDGVDDAAYCDEIDVDADHVDFDTDHDDFDVVDSDVEDGVDDCDSVIFSRRCCQRSQPNAHCSEPGESDGWR